MKESICDNNRPGMSIKRVGFNLFRNAKDNISKQLIVVNLKYKIYRIATYLLLLDMTFVFIFPFFYMVVASVKSSRDLYDFTVNWIPTSIHIKNYIIAFKTLEYPYYFKNSFIVTTLSTIGHLLSCSFIGYGFARYNFNGRKALFSMVILSLIIPVQTIIVPLYMVFLNLKWMNTFLPIVVPAFFGYGLKGGLFTFIFRQYYVGLPNSLEDAAKIDGCGFLKTYWKIVLPIAKSAFIVVLVLSIVWHWNDFYEPSIYCYTKNLTMLPNRLNYIVSLVNMKPEDLERLGIVGREVENAINRSVLMAGTFLVILPVLVSFSFLQRQFMQGIERTGIVE